MLLDNDPVPYDSSSDDSEELDGIDFDEYYKTGGQRGFQTNVNDFLRAFGSTLDRGVSENRLTKSKAMSKGPLLSSVEPTQSSVPTEDNDTSA